MMNWLLIAIALHATSGLPTLFAPRHLNIGQQLSALLSVLASGLGLAAVLHWLVHRGDETLIYNWPLMPGVDFYVSIDMLSAIFLLPILLVAALGSIYGLGYWPQSKNPTNGRKLRLFYGLLAAGMVLLVIARNSVLFLFGWEAMAISAYFLVTTEDHDDQVRETGWVYFVCTHIATLTLFALAGLLYGLTGGFDFGAPLPESVLQSPVLCNAIFLLTLFGFGFKAGIMPLHIWLPSAHANTPSHVSAIMSGVIIKMGIYGIVRVLSTLPDPPLWWGILFLLLGLTSGILGIAFGIGQGDLKRVLAYSSIENIGVIFLGLGLALIGRSMNRPDWVLLGLAGALMHVWNHALFKSLLFYGAGAVIHAAHTRRMDQLGGLAKLMPRTAIFVLVGITAASALPPLNAFASEFMIYLGMFRTLIDDPSSADNSLAIVALAVPGLAMIGALVVACYVIMYGTVFLGAPRSDHGRRAHDPGESMLLPMLVQAVFCLALGAAPLWVAPLFEDATRIWAPEMVGSALFAEASPLAELAPLGFLTFTAALLAGLAVAIGLWLRIQMSRRGVERSGTWGCGYAAPTARMQYTSSSMAQILVDQFDWALHPRRHLPHIRTLFPQGAHYAIEVRDVVLEQVAWPASRLLADRLQWFRWVQAGKVQAYLMYILVVLLFLFFWQ
jgi:hydrogenase-4 component B